jgi:hypothetical protein
MNARTLLLALPLALAAIPPRAGAQALPDPENGAITILLPIQWTGAGNRGITFGGAAVLVEGLASHPSGIERVSVAGNPATVLHDSSGATRFRVYLPAEAAQRDVEIVAFPVHGRPLVRVQHADGTYAVHAVDFPASALGPGGSAPLRPLHVHVADADAGFAARLGSVPGVVVDREPEGAQLSIRREGVGFLVVGPDGAVRHRVAHAEELAGTLAREVGALQLASLSPPPGGFAVEFGFPGGSDTFRLGGPIEFRVRSARDGYLTVIDLGTDGTLIVLFPVMNDDPRIRAGGEVLLPSRAVRSYFAPEAPYRATAPTGLGLVRAFVTQQPLALPSPGSGSLDAGAVLRALRTAIGEPVSIMQSPTWSTALLTYHVVP